MVRSIPKVALKAVAEILIPLGYQEDNQLELQKVRGKTLIGLNYVVVKVGLLLGVSTAILHHMPSTVLGLKMKQMEMSVEIPQTGLRLKSWSGVQIQVQLPHTHLDMSNGSDISATITLDLALQRNIAMLVCSVMVMITLPATITRIAMLNLECLVISRDDGEEDPKTDLGEESLSVIKELPSDNAGNGVKAGAAICCGTLGLIMVTLVLVGILGIVVFGI